MRIDIIYSCTMEHHGINPRPAGVFDQRRPAGGGGDYYNSPLPHYSGVLDVTESSFQSGKQYHIALILSRLEAAGRRGLLPEQVLRMPFATVDVDNSLETSLREWHESPRPIASAISSSASRYWAASSSMTSP